MIQIQIKNNKKVAKEINNIIKREEVDTLEVTKIDAIYGGAVVVYTKNSYNTVRCVSSGVIATDECNDKIQVKKTLDEMHKDLTKFIKSNFNIKIKIQTM